jgi:pilus assembly protein CpaB
MTDIAALSGTVRRLAARYRRVLGALLAAIAVLALVETLAPDASARLLVVVAAHDLPAGTRLAPGDVTLVGMPPHLVPAGAAAAREPVVGETVAGPMRAGEVVTDVRLVGRPLVSGYPRGTVAAPVRIHDSAVAGLLSVGDRIDVYAARSDTRIADLVVGDAAVMALPRDDDPGEGGGLLILAVTSAQAAALATAAATAPLSVTMLR